MSGIISQDYYKILGIPSTASADEIKKAYKKLCLKYHPDKTPNKSDHELFLKIREAYETLQSEDSKRVYDRNYGFSQPQKYSTTTSTTFTTSFSPSGARRQGYYGFYQRFYTEHDAHFQRAENVRVQMERELERKRKEELKRREEELFRKRREELLRKEKENLHKRQMEEQRREQMREEEIRIKQEKELESESPYAQRKKEAYKKQWESTDNSIHVQDVELNDQIFQKMNNQNRNYDCETPNMKYANTNKSSDSNEFKQHGTNSDDPIILDDDNNDNKNKEFTNTSESDKTKNPEVDLVSSDDEFVSFENQSNSSYNNNNKDNNDDDKEEAVTSDDLDTNLHNINDIIDQEMKFRPRQMPSKLQQKRQSVSPTRGNVGSRIDAPTSYVRNKRPSSRETSSKRPKSASDAFKLDQLKENLGNDIGNVDFSDILDSLPNHTYSNGKSRKVSDIDSNKKNKRPRLQEFSDGTSNAETLYTPINANSVKGHGMSSDKSSNSKKNITVLDLHASPKIHTYTPPRPPEVLVDTRMTEELWFKYVTSIQKYEKEFLEYKKHVVQYQLERCKKDEEYFDRINSSSSAFEIYQKCLDRDLQVFQQFTESLAQFTNTMNVFKQNCNWMKISNRNQ